MLAMALAVVVDMVQRDTPGGAAVSQPAGAAAGAGTEAAAEAGTEAEAATASGAGVRPLSGEVFFHFSLGFQASWHVGMYLQLPAWNAELVWQREPRLSAAYGYGHWLSAMAVSVAQLCC